jgi:hypothetical protein
MSKQASKQATSKTIYLSIYVLVCVCFNISGISGTCVLHYLRSLFVPRLLHSVYGVMYVFRSVGKVGVKKVGGVLWCIGFAHILHHTCLEESRIFLT